MKDIKLVVLDKYIREPRYKEVAFGIYHNSEAKNYCFCFEADEIDQYPLEDILDMYLLNCAEYSGDEVVISGETKIIAELETLDDSKKSLIAILNGSRIIEKGAVEDAWEELGS